MEGHLITVDGQSLDISAATVRGLIDSSTRFWLDLMGIDHLAHAMGEAGSEPLAGEHSSDLGAGSLGLDRAPAGR